MLTIYIHRNTTDSVAEQLYDPLYRVSGSGESAGLSLLLDVQKDDYVAYSKSFYGAEILIHDPQDFPQTSVMSAVAQPGTDLLLSIIPTVTMSEEDVKSLSLRQRSCLFDDEVFNIISLTESLMHILLFFAEETKNNKHL